MYHPLDQLVHLYYLSQFLFRYNHIFRHFLLIPDQKNRELYFHFQNRYRFLGRLIGS